METLCGASTATPPTVEPCTCSPSVTWTSVTRTRIGSTNLRHPSTLSYSIPNVIPSTAKEVRIYISAQTGGSDRGAYQQLKIFTQEGSARYEQYLFLQSWAQNAINSNSENMWFPMPTNRRVYLTVQTDQGPNCEAELFAIGYRWTCVRQCE